MRMNKILFLTISLALLSLLQLGFAQVAPAQEVQTVNSVPVVTTTTTQQPAPVTATPAQTTTTVQQPPVVTQQAPAAQVTQTVQTAEPAQVVAPAAQPAQVAAPAAQPAQVAAPATQPAQVDAPAAQPAAVTPDATIEQPQTPPVVITEAPSVPESTFDTYYRPIDQDEKATNPNNPNAKATGTIDTMMNYVDAPLMDIVWCGANKKVMFMLTTSLSLYRSENDGFTGHVMKEHLHKLGRAELGNEPGEVGDVSKIMQNPVDKNMILLVGTHGINWVTENCGGSFRAMNQGRRVDDFQFHPTERTWLLASAWTVCDDFVGEPCRNYKELFVSKDLGNNWEMVADYVYQFSWAALDKPDTQVPKERIIVAQDPRGNGNQTEGGWIKHHVVAAFDEFGKSFTPLVIGGNKFLLTDDFFFVVQAKDDEAKDVTLLTANPNAKHYIFRQIEIPAKRILDFGYTVLDASEHAVFLHIDHGSTQATYGTLYVSDSTGVRFSQALKHNARAPTGQCDFERVQGLEGIYLANIYDAEVVKKFQNIEADYWNDFPVQQGGSKKTSEDAFKHPDHYVADLNLNSHTNRADSLKKTLEDFKKTMISFDKGSMWQTLVPPATDVTGKKIICNSEDECALHLHSVTSKNFGPIYSTENSLGLLLGTGNIGEFLSTRPDETNTYLSRDGGLTWFEIAKGPHIYEIGDHGGLIVMAPSMNATRDIYYSWNEGLTWETARISDKHFHVSNIIMEPSNTGEKFMIYGREAKGQKGVIAAIDFSSLHQKTCMLPSQPDTPESDYETWTPNGRISPHCLLGRQVTYTRRKRESKCFNAEEHETWKIVHQCACTEEDWECDYGFARQNNGPCLAMDDNIKNQSIATPEVCDAYYFMTQGYRKVSGNGCTGGVNHEPIRLPCPGTGVITSKNLSILMLLGSILLAFVWLNNSQNTDKVKGYFYTFKSKLGAIFSKSPAPSKQGYTAHIPNKYADDEDTFTNIIFDENEDTDEPRGDTIDLIEGAHHRKMTERKAMDTAKKHVPLLNRPGDKKLDVIRGNF